MITQEERKYLIDSMSALLDEYGYKHTDMALNKIIDKWGEQKADLIEAFKKHPNYVEGKFMIATTSKYERSTDKDQIKKFSYWLNGHAMRDLDLTPQNILDRRNGCTWLPNELWEFLMHLDWYDERCLSKETVKVINRAIPEVHVHAGEKTSRAVNRVLTYLRYNTVRGYDKEFAKYSDALSPMIVERRTILSINPIDYLTMSFGNSWSSCHTIDKENRRNMPNGYRGEYSSGTMSYMLDKTSMVFYTVDNGYDGTDYCLQPKINRQIFHYGKEKLIQGRLYPQDNDYFGGAYTQYRNIVQSIIATVFGFTNLWTFQTGTDAASEYVISKGTHYRDYENFSNCSISRIKGSANEGEIVIGEYPICVRCGKAHRELKTIDCCIYKRCEHCGRVIVEHDGIEINGHFYCDGCVYRCDKCGEFHVGIPTRTKDGWVCNACLNKFYIKCNNCGRWVKKSNIIKKDGRNLCKHCKDDINTQTFKFTLSANKNTGWYTINESTVTRNIFWHVTNND